MPKPVLALTLGDSAGIGPEITAKTFCATPIFASECVPVVIGDADAMRRGVKIDGRRSVCRARHRRSRRGRERSRAHRADSGRSAARGRCPSAQSAPLAGDAAYRFVVEACALAKSGKVSGIVTAPLNKAAMHAGGHKWPGHTELLAHEFGVKNFSLVLSAGESVFLSSHDARVAEGGDREHHARALRRAARSRRRLRARARLGERADRPGRTESSCGRRRPVRARRCGSARACRGAREGARTERRRPAAGRRADSRGGAEASGGSSSSAITTRGTRRSRRSTATTASTSRSACRSCECRSITARRSISPGKGVAREDSLVLSCRRAAQLAPGWRLIAGERTE